MFTPCVSQLVDVILISLSVCRIAESIKPNLDFLGLSLEEICQTILLLDSHLCINFAEKHDF